MSAKIRHQNLLQQAKPFTLTRLDVETFPEIKRLPVRSNIALKKREAKIADSADALRTLKSTVIAATVSKSQTKEAEQMILDKSAKLLPIPERVFTKFLQSQNNKSKSQLSHEVGASSIYSHQLIKTETDFEPLTHYERRKLEVKKRVYMLLISYVYTYYIFLLIPFSS